MDKDTSSSPDNDSPPPKEFQQPEEDLFHKCLKLPPEERESFVESSCEDDSVLKENVLSLLRSHDMKGVFLDSIAEEDSKALATRLQPTPSAELSAGDHIGRYRLLKLLGEGAWGSVWMAEQTVDVKRRVALKILKLGLDTKDFLARFEAERQVLAMMEHPNIAQMLDAGATSLGRPYFVMELVRGLPLVEYADRERLSIEERIKLFIPICRAIHHAHKKGIIHRDLKPSNILVPLLDDKPVPKIIDFGVAKSTQFQLTDKTLFTGFHTFVGTPVYSSPEQLECSGIDVDNRSDIYSLGALLYELLCGQTPIDQELVLEHGMTLLRKMVREQDPARPSDRFGSLSAEEQAGIAKRRRSPPSKLERRLRGDLDWIILKCLEKDRRDRYETADALAEDLKGVLGHKRVSTAAPSQRFNSVILGLVVLVLAFLVVDRYLLNSPSSSKVDTRDATLGPYVSSGVKRAVITLDEGQVLALAEKAVSGGDALRPLALSPDGSHLAYVLNVSGKQQLYLRRMDTYEARPLEGTEGGFLPFFSPDSQWIGFFKRGQLMKISVQGGAPQAIVEAGDAYEADWGPQNTILFVEKDRRQFSIVSADGGAKQIILDGLIDMPKFLPDGRGILFANFATLSPSVEIFLPETGEIIPIIERGATPHYVPTGHILYTSDSGISAVPFDISTYRVTGPSVPVLNDVRSELVGYSHMTISSDGLLAYVPGKDMSLSTPVWVDRNGKEEPIPLPPKRYSTFDLSPDNSKVAFLVDGPERDVWIYEIESDAVLRRFTVGGNKLEPIWSPDGNSIAFGIVDSTEQDSGIFIQGVNEDKALPVISSRAWINSPSSWVKNNLLVYTEESRAGEDGDVWVANLDGNTVREQIVSTPDNEWDGYMSPDGRYIAYISNESGLYQVYVKPYPPTEKRWMISVDGGLHIVWSAKGDEIFYRHGQEIFSVPVQTEPEFKFDAPRVVLRGPYIWTWDSSYDVTSDGQRFLMLKPIDQDPVTKIHIVANWFEELQRLVPTQE